MSDTPLPINSPLKPKRRWFQFSLRTLLVAMLVFGCGLGWLVNERNKVAEIQRTFQYLENHGWRFWSDAESFKAPWSYAIFGDDRRDVDGANYSGHPDEPANAKKQIGKLLNLKTIHLDGVTQDDDLANLACLTNLRTLDVYDGSKITDEGVKHLSGMLHLETLSLRDASITDVGLLGISRLSCLKALDLSRTRITDEGLPSLKKLRELTEVNLGFTRITDVGLEQLADMKDLVSLYLYETSITDRGLARLAKRNNYKELFFGNTRITDDGLWHLEKMTELIRLSLVNLDITDCGIAQIAHLNKLKFLDISGTAITEAGLPNVSRLTSLKHIYLGFGPFERRRQLQHRITDDGLVYFASLPKLKFLDLRNTKVSSDGVANLKKTLPKLTVYWESLDVNSKE